MQISFDNPRKIVYLLGMKENENRNEGSDMTQLVEMGFSQLGNSKIFVLRKAHTYIVKFQPHGVFEVRSKFKPNSRDKIWTVGNFIKVLELLEKFNIK